jgi:hypothetical protein
MKDNNGIYYLKQILISVYWRLRLKKIYAYIFVFFRSLAKISFTLARENLNHIAIVVMVKSEERYIRHWIRFHSRVGILNFYIY